MLYAVAIYGIGANNNLPKFLERTLSLPVANSNLLELKRLVRIEPKEDGMPLTRFLSICHKTLKKEGYRYVASFSDPEYNPSGGIYAAANFKQIGLTQPEADILNTVGQKIGRRTLLHWRKRNGNPSIDDACKQLGFTRVKTPPKKRWFISL